MTKIFNRCNPKCHHFCSLCFSLNNDAWLSCVVCVCRDSLWLCALNSCTSFAAGFAVFSVLGFMSDREGVSIDMVVESGIVQKAQFLILLLSGCTLSEKLYKGKKEHSDDFESRLLEKRSVVLFQPTHAQSSFLRQITVKE